MLLLNPSTTTGGLTRIVSNCQGRKRCCLRRRSEHEGTPRTHPAHAQHHHPRSADYEAWRHLYEQGWSTPKIATRFDTNPGNVHRGIIKVGGTVGRRTPTNKLFETSQERAVILQLHNEGLRPQAIADRLGTSGIPVRRVLKEEGIKSYPPGRPYE